MINPEVLPIVKDRLTHSLGRGRVAFGDEVLPQPHLMLLSKARLELHWRVPPKEMEKDGGVSYTTNDLVGLILSELNNDYATKGIKGKLIHVSTPELDPVDPAIVSFVLTVYRKTSLKERFSHFLSQTLSQLRSRILGRP